MSKYGLSFHFVVLCCGAVSLLFFSLLDVVGIVIAFLAVFSAVALTVVLLLFSLYISTLSLPLSFHVVLFFLVLYLCFLLAEYRY